MQKGRRRRGEERTTYQNQNTQNHLVDPHLNLLSHLLYLFAFPALLPQVQVQVQVQISPTTSRCQAQVLQGFSRCRQQVRLLLVNTELLVWWHRTFFHLIIIEGDQRGNHDCTHSYQRQSQMHFCLCSIVSGTSISLLVFSIQTFMALDIQISSIVMRTKYQQKREDQVRLYSLPDPIYQVSSIVSTPNTHHNHTKEPTNNEVHTQYNNFTRRKKATPPRGRRSRSTKGTSCRHVSTAWSSVPSLRLNQ